MGPGCGVGGGGLERDLLRVQPCDDLVLVSLDARLHLVHDVQRSLGQLLLERLVRVRVRARARVRVRV